MPKMPFKNPERQLEHAINDSLKRLKSKGSNVKSQQLAKYMQTGLGQYGEGDEFIGVSVPMIRQEIKDIYNRPISRTDEIDFIFKICVQSKIHEYRLFGLLVLVKLYQKKCLQQSQPIANYIVEKYIYHTPWINNWDLVDSSAPALLGDYLLRKYSIYTMKSGDIEELNDLFHGNHENSIDKLPANGHLKDLWSKRIAVVCTLSFIRTGIFNPTYELCKKVIILSRDGNGHNLLEKASGWMLREVGKKNEKSLLLFLQENYDRMPRVMLRYSIEKLSPALQHRFMEKKKT